MSAGEKNGPEIFADLYFAEVIDFWFETHRLTLAKPTVYNYKKYMPLVKQYFAGALVQKITQEDVFGVSRISEPTESQEDLAKKLHQDTTNEPEVCTPGKLYLSQSMRWRKISEHQKDRYYAVPGGRGYCTIVPRCPTVG